MKKIRLISFLIFFIFVTNFIVFSPVVNADELRVSAKCAVALDCDSKLVLYDKNAEMIVPMASTTKIMTCIVALRYGNLDKKFEISSRSANISGSTVGYKKGEKVALRELLYGLMLRSGNDAAIAIAEGISGSVEQFCKLMNEYAVEIGLTNSHFESPHGLDSNSHYSTAYDLALITSKAKEYKLFNEIVSAKDVDGKQYGFSRSFHNINKILWLLPEADGVKTGSTGDAGKCLVTSVKLKGKNVVIVVLNCVQRWRETKKIYDYVNKNFVYRKLIPKGKEVCELDVANGRSKIKLVCSKELELPLKIGNNYNVKLVTPDKVYAPIKKYDKIGSLCVYENGKMIYDQALEASKDSPVKGLRKFLFFKK